MWLRFLLITWLAAATGFSADAVVAAGRKAVRVVVIPVREEIAAPQLFILRRGLKDAESEKADLVVLDMKTPAVRSTRPSTSWRLWESFPARPSRM
jgi:membrane-bound ClpP family serine protease